jgi:hypothetical protein
VETSDVSGVHAIAIAAGAIVMGAAVASVILTYKLHQPRASDCGDFEECYGYAGGIVTFLAMCGVDIVASAVFLAYMALEEARHAAVIAYSYAVATAVTGLVVVTVWFFNGHPPPHTIPTLVGASCVFALTVLVLGNIPYALAIALGAVPLAAFALMTLFAIAI